MAKNKPEDMSDEMWTAVCIVMEDKQIKSFKDMTDSHQAVITRMDEMENKWAESQASTDPQTQGGGDAGGSGSGEGPGAAGGVGDAVPVSGGEGSPPPVVEKTSDDEPKGSGRAGKLRWHERDGYAK